MKKFTKILICFMLCVFGVMFVACDNRTKKEKAFTYPKAKDIVTGNGGLAVKKGNYVYFVNGTKSVKDVTKKKAKYNVGSLMLMKLDKNGEVVREANGLVNDDYYITMSKKLCGYEATNLFISGNYLYFVTPCLENENDNKTWAKERVIFNRIKLDKTGDVETVYESNVKYDALQYNYYEQNGKTYILVYETGDSYYSKKGGNNILIKVDASEKSKKEISKNVSSIVFAENTDEIFYVIKDKDEKYDVKQFNIVSGDSEDYSLNNNDEITVKFVANGYVYATKKHDTMTNYTDLVRSNIANKTTFSLFHSNVGTNEVQATVDGTAVMNIKDKTFNIITTNQVCGAEGTVVTRSITDSEIDKVNVIGYTNGSILYYGKINDKYVVRMFSYFNAVNGDDCEIKTVVTLDSVNDSTLNISNFDVSSDEGFMYYIEQLGTNNYLHRIKVVNNIAEEKEMFGVYESEDDIPKAEEIEE